MLSKRGFTLTEVLIATVLMGVVILAVTSVDITSRKFFGAAGKKTRIQDEAKIAMEHMARYIRLGIGDRTNPGTSDGFIISGGAGTVQIKLDTNNNGKFDSGVDKIIEYKLIGYRIRYDPDTSTGSSQEFLTDDVVSSCVFSAGSAPNHNQVDISITVREKPQPGNPAGPENPETTLTSSIVLRAMSTN